MITRTGLSCGVSASSSSVFIENNNHCYGQMATKSLNYGDVIIVLGSKLIIF